MNGSGKIELETIPTYTGVVISCLWLMFFGYAIYNAMSNDFYLSACIAILCYNCEIRLMYDKMNDIRLRKIAKQIS